MSILPCFFVVLSTCFCVYPLDVLLVYLTFLKQWPSLLDADIFPKFLYPMKNRSYLKSMQVS